MIVFTKIGQTQVKFLCVPSKTNFDFTTTIALVKLNVRLEKPCFWFSRNLNVKKYGPQTHTLQHTKTDFNTPKLQALSTVTTHGAQQRTRLSKRYISISSQWAYLKYDGFLLTLARHLFGDSSLASRASRASPAPALAVRHSLTSAPLCEESGSHNKSL